MRIGALVRLLPTLFIFAVILGGIYGGVFTPTEASAVGAASAIAVAFWMRRLTWQNLKTTHHLPGSGPPPCSVPAPRALAAVANVMAC